MASPSILIIIPYFGQWPKWINHFMLSCQYNLSINWLFFTDCGLPVVQPKNATFIEIDFQEYKNLISKKLNINFHTSLPYKLCDVRPAYGVIHEDYLDGYDFFGFGDIDVIYGDLRQFLPDTLLEKNQLISTHPDRVSGHFCLLKNNSAMRNAFRKIPHWKKLFENPKHLSIDESKFTKVFMPHRKHPLWLKKIYSLFSPYWRNNLFHEQYSTILSSIPWFNGADKHPQEWYWKAGHLTNSLDGEHEFMYLHFMNWQSGRWLDKKYGDTSAWELSGCSFQFNLNSTPDGFGITRKGIHDQLPE